MQVQRREKWGGGGPVRRLGPGSCLVPSVYPILALVRTVRESATQEAAGSGRGRDGAEGMGGGWPTGWVRGVTPSSAQPPVIQSRDLLIGLGRGTKLIEPNSTLERLSM